MSDKEWRAVESGPHLGLVRNFIQWHAINGSDVTWGSNDLVRFSSVTVDDLEQLAQRIYDAGKKAGSK